MTQIGFDLVYENLHQADDYARHSGTQGVANQKPLVEGTFDLDRLEDTLHNFPAIIDPGPHHVFAFEFPFFLQWAVLYGLHFYLMANVQVSGDF
jgi:hypothetical protein